MVDWIAKDLEATTLRYQTIDDMVSAVGIPKEKLCLYCWNGLCPTCPKGPQDNTQKTTVVKEAYKILKDKKDSK